MSTHAVAVAALPVALAAAAALHETAHVAAARFLGAEARVETHRRGAAWWTTTWRVAYWWPGDRGREAWMPAFVGMAPLLSGLWVGTLWLVSMGVSLTPWGLVGAAGWAMYTLSGGPEDYRPLVEVM